MGASIASSVRSRAAVKPFSAARCQVVVMAQAEPRLRLNNLGPEPGSRRQELRKGRGTAAGQVRRIEEDKQSVFVANRATDAGWHMWLRQPRPEMSVWFRHQAWIRGWPDAYVQATA